MDTRQLRAFKHVYELRHLSRAAQALNVSQSAVSFHLAKLEEEFGTALFQREPRGMRPTAAGERLYQHAAPILRAIQVLREDMTRAPDHLSGEVSLGLAYSAMKAIGRKLIRTVLSDYPDVRLSLMDSIPGTALLSLLQTSMDVALVFNPLDSSEIKKSPILREQLVCVGRPDVVGDTDGPIELDHLLSLPLIFFRRLGALLDNISLLRQIDAKAKLRLTSVQGITEALLDGLGCMIGTKTYFRTELQAGTLHYRPIAGSPIVRTLYLCQIADRPATLLTETMSALMVRLVTEAVENGEWDASLL
jgi:LysR family nitrogen assimilation transcriptional regulator